MISKFIGGWGNCYDYPEQSCAPEVFDATDLYTSGFNFLKVN